MIKTDDIMKTENPEPKDPGLRSESKDLTAANRYSLPHPTLVIVISAMVTRDKFFKEHSRKDRSILTAFLSASPSSDVLLEAIKSGIFKDVVAVDLVNLVNTISSREKLMDITDFEKELLRLATNEVFRRVIKTGSALNLDELQSIEAAKLVTTFASTLSQGPTYQEKSHAAAVPEPNSLLTHLSMLVQASLDMRKKGLRDDKKATATSDDGNDSTAL